MIDFDADYEIYFDGGSKNNGRPDSEAYGSFKLVAGERSEIIRLTFDRGLTNNQAEYRALLSALNNLMERIHKAGRHLNEFTVHIHGDSAIVLGQVYGITQCHADHLRVLRDQCQEILKMFKQWQVTQHPREEIVPVLGH